MPLVGRDRELAVLGEGISRMLAGERAVLVMTGEPGIGKTRLLEKLTADARAAGAAVAWGRMWEVGLTPAFGPWIQILGGLETNDDRAPPLAMLDERADAAVRLARFADVVAFIVRRAAVRPVLLVFDDVHAADPSSLQLVEYAVPMLADHRVLVALAARDEASGDAAAVLGRIQRGARRLPLARLGADDVRELVAGRADSVRVFELSEGNPLFVEELVASAEGGGPLELPRLSSVREVIRDRVARLPEASAALVTAASVVGREFGGRVVAEMLDRGDIGAALAPVVRLGMAHMTAPDRYKFSHALIAEAIADEIDPSERARLHLRAARALERHETADASAIAHHLLAAGHLAAEAAIVAAERAAKAASAQLAFEDAAALLERALAFAGGDPRRTGELLVAQAEALQHASQHARAAALCDRAAQLARDAGDAKLLARVAIARGLEFRFGRTDPVLVDALREALAKLELGDLGLRARVMARLAAAEQPARDPMGPVALALEAIAVASTLGPRDRLDVNYVATAALVDYLEPARLDPILEATLDLARGTDRWITVHTRVRRCYTALERLDRPGFDRCVQEFADDARALGVPRWTRQIEMLTAMTAILEGRFADADAALARVDDQGPSDWVVAVHRVFTEYVRTEPLSAASRAQAMMYPPGRAIITAWLAMLDGDVETCRAALGQVAEVPVDSDLGSVLGVAIAFAGDRERVEATYTKLLPRSGRIALASMVGSTVIDLFDRILLVLATALGDVEAAERHAKDAFSVAHKLGSPPFAAKIRADLAAARDSRELWQAALADAERIGMPGLAARCRAALGGVAKPAPAKTQERVELARAGSLWTMRGFGEEIHIKDSRGMQMLARLIADPGRDIHVLELAGSQEGVDGGDAGEVIDTRAREQYKSRLAELAAERDRAEAWGDAGRAERASEEIEVLTSELERALGLGGRERRVGGAAERARSNAQRRITHALEQIRAASRRLGEHLTASIKTGTYCSYNLT